MAVKSVNNFTLYILKSLLNLIKSFSALITINAAVLKYIRTIIFCFRNELIENFWTTSHARGSKIFGHQQRKQKWWFGIIKPYRLNLKVKKIPVMENWDSFRIFYLAFRQQTIHFETLHYWFFGQYFIPLAFRRKEIKELCTRDILLPAIESCLCFSPK